MSEKAVVIGSGFGGLAAAVRLRAMGYAVTVVEALEQAGGRARVFREGGFTFDAGPTVITAPQLLTELFALAGREAGDYYGLEALDPFYRIRFADGETFDYTGEEGRLVAEVARLSAGDVAGYRRLAAQARRIFEVGYDRLADRPFHSVWDMVRAVPSMVRLESRRSVYGLVSRYIRDERLRQVFSFEPLLVGGNPMRVTSIYLLIHWLERKWGVHYARGGTGAIIGSLVRLLGEMGVELRLGEAVAEIEVSGRRVVGVRTASGSRMAATLVVSNADPSYVYRWLVPARFSRRAARKVRRLRSSMGLFVGYFGVRGTYPELAHHTIVLGPRYGELLGDIFERRVLAEDLSLYLHAPARTDPTMAPRGHEAMYVLSPVPNNRSGIDWSREAEPYFDRILASLEDRLLPGLRDRIVVRRLMTPDDFERDLRSPDGAAFGPEPLLTQSAWFRHHNRSPWIDGLCFVGAGVHPGAGVPGVLNSAKLLERIVPRPARSTSRTHHGWNGSRIGRRPFAAAHGPLQGSAPTEGQ